MTDKKLVPIALLETISVWLSVAADGIEPYFDDGSVTPNRVELIRLSEQVKAIAAAPDDGQADEVSWLIEMKLNWGTGNYWGGYKRYHEWTTVDKAVRFSRKADADRVISGLSPYDVEVIATEHMWCAPSSEQNAAATQMAEPARTGESGGTLPSTASASPAAPSATPRTDAVDAIVTGWLDAAISNKSSGQDVAYQIARKAMAKYGLLCNELERELTALRAPSPKKIGVHDVDEFYKDEQPSAGVTLSAEQIACIRTVRKPQPGDGKYTDCVIVDADDFNAVCDQALAALRLP